MNEQPFKGHAYLINGTKIHDAVINYHHIVYNINSITKITKTLSRIILDHQDISLRPTGSKFSTHTLLKHT